LHVPLIPRPLSGATASQIDESCNILGWKDGYRLQFRPHHGNGAEKHRQPLLGAGLRQRRGGSEVPGT